MNEVAMAVSMAAGVLKPLYQGTETELHRQLTALVQGGKLPEKPEKIISPAEAAQALDASRDSIKRLVRAGKLRGTRVGNRIKVYENSVVEYLRKREKSAREGKV